MGYLKSTGTVFIYIGLFLALVAFLPGIPPHVQFSEYSIPSPRVGLKDDLLSNKKLENAEILFKGELKGPETFASYNGELYTSLHGGNVVKIVGNHIVPITKFGKPCDGFWMEKECGRPLGLEFDKSGTLYVIDTYFGIFKVDVTTGKYEKIVDISKPIEGVVPKLANSLDIASNGDIYWTDSSSDFILQDGVMAFLANPSGRLIKYDAATKKNIVLLNNLAFANGVKLSKDESFVVVAETVTSRLIKFNLKGDKSGKAEIFVEGLPGLPDNIHSDGKDGFLVGLIATVVTEQPALIQSLPPHPYIRKMLTRLLYLLEAPFKLVEDVYPNHYSKRAMHWIGHFESMRWLVPESVLTLRIDGNGKIIESAGIFDGQINAISSAFVFKDNVYLGSPYNDYIARVPLARAFPSIKTESDNIFSGKVIEKREVKEEPKPAVSRKETTTPPPPTTTSAPLPTTTPAPPTTTPPPPTKTSAPLPTTTPAPPTTTPPPPSTTSAPTTTSTSSPPKTVPTTPKPTATRDQPQQQQQKPRTPTPTEPVKETTAKPVQQAPASPPPTPSPSNKQPVREDSPASKPVQPQQAAKNVEPKDNTVNKPAPDTVNVQKPTKPVPLSENKNSQKDTGAKREEKTAKDNTVNKPVSDTINVPEQTKPVPVSENKKSKDDTETKRKEETVKPPVPTKN